MSLEMTIAVLNGETTSVKSIGASVAWNSPIHQRQVASGRDIGRCDEFKGTHPAKYKRIGLDALERAYESIGGTISADQMMQRLRSCSDQPISILAHWIVDRDIVLIDRQGEKKIPTFQFVGSSCIRRPEVASVIAELRSVHDDRELATWFVTPNSWIDNALPVRMINVEPNRVFEAARVDRFVARG